MSDRYWSARLKIDRAKQRFAKDDENPGLFTESRLKCRKFLRLSHLI
jgi:hypothetical protein